MSTFYIQQFGCRATQADGAALERQLLDRGYTPAPDPASASIVVLNTCTVTAAADAQARDSIRKIHAQNPHARLIVTGCYAQRAPQELSTLPGVTHVVGNSHKPQIPNLIGTLSTNSSTASLVGAQHAAPHLGIQRSATPPSAFSAFLPTAVLTQDASMPPLDVPPHSSVGARHALPASSTPSNPQPTPPAQILTGDIFAHPEFLSAPIQGGESHHTRPILKIQDGCNNRCSFCIIPYVRGKSRSLPLDQVIREIQTLTSPQVAQVYPEPRRAILAVHRISTQPTHTAKEIVLSGINLGTYGRDLSPKVDLLTLIRRILNETQIDRLRLSSIEPQDVTQDLIHLFAENDRLAQHFHIPLQSASNKILAAMYRWYRAEHYARRLDQIHSLLPNAAIGADVIAGHPGETDSDHAATLSFIQQHPFTYLHVFSYSPRPGTKAAAHPDQVPPAVIKQRARQLRALSEQKSAAFRHFEIGRTLKVLTLHRDDHSDSDTTPTLSTNYLRVQVPAILPSNQWVEIQVTGVEGNELRGELTEVDHQTLCESSAPDRVGASLR